MGLFTVYPNPPDPPYSNQLSDTGYQFLWNLHRATTTGTIFVDRKLHTFGLQLLETGKSHRIYTHQECKVLFPRQHATLLWMLNHYRLEEHEFTALLSLGLSLGVLGLAGSRVIWDITQNATSELEASWNRYIWLGPDKMQDELVKRHIEYSCFVNGFGDPLVTGIRLGSTRWKASNYLPQPL